MSDESTLQKRCSKCGEHKSPEMFYKDKKRKDGLCPQCKTCMVAYRIANRDAICARKRAYHWTHRDTLLEKRRAVYAANPTKKLEQDRVYRTRNVEALRQYFHNYHAKNAQRIREYRQKNADRIAKRRRVYNSKNAETNRKQSLHWRATNKDHIQAYQRTYRNANLDRFRLASQKRRARVKENGGTFTREELTLMRLTQGGFCFYCQRPHDPNNLTIDHVIPLDQGGRHEAPNIVLACTRCNCSKNNRTPDQWVNRWYYGKS